MYLQKNIAQQLNNYDLQLHTTTWVNFSKFYKWQENTYFILLFNPFEYRFKYNPISSL